MKRIFNITQYCKICNKKGTTILNEDFLNERNIKFLNKFYKKKFFTFLKMKNFSNFKYRLLKCENCLFIWQEKSLKKNYSEILYDKIIDNKISYKKNKLKYQNGNQFFLEKYLITKKIKKDSKILDIGAGWGNWLINYSENYKLYAIEFSKKRRIKLKKLKIKIIDEYKFQKYINSFNVIKLDQVLEHINNLDKFLVMVKKFTTNKKRLVIISVPNGRKIIKNMNFPIYSKGPLQPLEHLNCFSNYSLVKLMKKYGYNRLNLLELCWIFVPFLIKNPKKFINIGKRIYDQFYGTNIIFK